MKIGKGNGKRKKKNGFSASWARGEFLAQPGASTRAASWAGGPLGPPAGEMASGWRGDGVVARAHMAEEGGLTARNGDRGEREPARVRPPVKSRGGSPSGVRFCDRRVVAMHGRG
jgi:hypothetical protein